MGRTGGRRRWRAAAAAACVRCCCCGGGASSGRWGRGGAWPGGGGEFRWGRGGRASSRRAIAGDGGGGCGWGRLGYRESGAGRAGSLRPTEAAWSRSKNALAHASTRARCSTIESRRALPRNPFAHFFCRPRTPPNTGPPEFRLPAAGGPDLSPVSLPTRLVRPSRPAGRPPVGGARRAVRRSRRRRRRREGRRRRRSRGGGAGRWRRLRRHRGRRPGPAPDPGPGRRHRRRGGWRS